MSGELQGWGLQGLGLGLQGVGVYGGFNVWKLCGCGWRLKTHAGFHMSIGESRDSKDFFSSGSMLEFPIFGMYACNRI